MKKKLYNIPVLHISVALYTGGWNIIINTHNYCQRQRLERIWLEREGSNKRFHPEHLTGDCGYGTSQQRAGCFEYTTDCTPDNQDKAIEFLKNKILEDVTNWNRALNAMIENTDKETYI